MGENGFFKKSFRKAKTAASEKMAEYKREKAYERAASKQIKSKARVAGYKAREKQAVRYAEKSEEYKTTRRLKAMKSPRPSFSGFGGTGGGRTSPSLNTMLGGSNFLQGYASRAMGKTKMAKSTTYVKTKGGYKKKTVYKKRKVRGKPQQDPLSKMLGV